MPHSLEFDVLHEYNQSAQGITVPVILRSASRQVQLLAKLDTGAEFCFFAREYGEELNLDIERGTRLTVQTAAGTFVAYGHEVTLSSLGFEFHVMVYFAAQENFRRNVLGRYGWIQQTVLGIIDYERKMYVRKYGSQSC